MDLPLSLQFPVHNMGHFVLWLKGMLPVTCRGLASELMLAAVFLIPAINQTI